MILQGTCPECPLISHFYDCQLWYTVSYKMCVSFSLNLKSWSHQVVAIWMSGLALFVLMVLNSTLWCLCCAATDTWVEKTKPHTVWEEMQSQELQWDPSYHRWQYPQLTDRLLILFLEFEKLLNTIRCSTGWHINLKIVHITVKNSL